MEILLLAAFVVAFIGFLVAVGLAFTKKESKIFKW